MPIGVPKVFDLVTETKPEEERDSLSPDSWVDVYDRLYQERLLFLGKEADPETSNQVMGLFIALSLEDPIKQFFLFINSPGGALISGVGIFDTMRGLPQDVHTICVGLAASIASFILAGGSDYKRIAYPHSRVMIHQPASSFFESPLGEFIVESNELLRMREMLVRAYQCRTHQSFWAISEDMERDVFLSPKEAQTHGLVDLVGFATLFPKPNLNTNLNPNIFLDLN
uniref:ATP-dependent Clp protease proteolytic subunit n=1 Tax=Litwinowia tenuissima TaxID=537172 RepID=A0A6M8Z1L9_9BRAS|nr:ATP-dependent protease subunit [Litwinowia tenuissima]QKK45066.1 ATP-dependent protease subunit [Litwinowia tenuissima]